MNKYFYNFGFDFFFLSGISVLLWAIVFFFTQGGQLDLLYQLAGVMSWFINWPHFAATSYRLYHRKEFFMQFPMTSFFIPVMVVTATVFSLMNPDSFALIWVKFYLIWSPYHYSGQTLGLSLLYGRRGGITISPIQRFFLAAFIYGTFIYTTAASEAGEGMGQYFGVNFPRFGLPMGFVDGVKAWLIISGIGFIVSFYPHLRRWKVFPSLILILPLTQAFWFLLAPKWPGFQAFVPALHSLQYLFIAWMLQLSERHESTLVTGTRFRIEVETLRWYVINIFLGIILFKIIPESSENLGLKPLFAFGVIHASVQIHHFFVDGVVWKLKDSKISSPLMVNIEQWKTS